ncbi:MMPL family transporter [Nocardiopsis changdeensis]|uniref:MMPL family transporter n=1 Tax=Nocardiopsis changdeensis TaxID=2831969 RepID=A0ABX8BSK2_9ACTN|nr:MULTISPECIES: MMPL family transporter [Nocardiopsis]QUX24768.1 MMPL family transporter [Nocardiopsis changdeensis]QYX35155.1 MMPL family transporter [Nocardiopsis sp. MT53]
MLDALTRLTTRRPWWVLAAALLAVIGAVVLGSGVADRLRAGQGTEDPSSESARAAEILEEHFPDSRPNLILLVTAEDGVDDREAAARALGLAEGLAYEDGVAGVTSYWQTGSDELKSDDGTRALIAAHVSGTEAEAGAAVADLAERYGGDHGPLTVGVGGQTAVLNDIETTIAEDLVRSEVIALPLTLLILVWVFGSVVSASLPLLVGVVSIIGTNAVLWAIAGFTDVSVFAQNLTIALGLGLSIDYALLMVRRFRAELATGATPAQATLTTVRTAGRTVVFSALAISAALAGMLFFPLYFLRSFAYSGVTVVLLAALTSLVVLPAVLTLLGPRVNALDPRRLLRRGSAPPPEEAADRRWGRLTRAVMGRAPVFALTALALLVAVGLPFLRVEFGMADDRQLPAGVESREVMDTIRTDFGSTATGAVDVLVHQAPQDTDTGLLDDYAAALSRLDNVQEVRSPLGVHTDGGHLRERTPVDALRESEDLAYIQVIPDAEVEDISLESQNLVRDIRAVGTPLEVSVTGQAAAVVDAQAAIAERVPATLAVVVAAMLVLVYLLTGSVLLPLLSVLFNALSLTAMFGAVVWVFQDGNLSGLLGFTPTGFIDTALPVLMFCIAFGLSMDYGVFLLSRMREEYDRTGDHRTAVELGLRRTGGIITAAAVALAVVLVVIGASRVTNTMMLGWGVALAVIADATVVRCLLVPSVLRMTGAATWWAPGPLRRFHRFFDATLGENAAEPGRAAADRRDPAGPAQTPAPEPGAAPARETAEVARARD